MFTLKNAILNIFFLTRENYSTYILAEFPQFSQILIRVNHGDSHVIVVGKFAVDLDPLENVLDAF